MCIECEFNCQSAGITCFIKFEWTFLYDKKNYFCCKKFIFVASFCLALINEFLLYFLLNWIKICGIRGEIVNRMMWEKIERSRFGVICLEFGSFSFFQTQNSGCIWNQVRLLTKLRQLYEGKSQRNTEKNSVEYFYTSVALQTCAAWMRRCAHFDSCYRFQKLTCNPLRLMTLWPKGGNFFSQFLLNSWQLQWEFDKFFKRAYYQQ